MNTIEKILSNVIFGLQVLLLFLLLFEQHISLPYWLQPLGRMHPLLLHLPIGFLLMLGLFQLVKKEVDPGAFFALRRFGLYLTAFTAVLTAIMGLFLAREGAYTASALSLHKWTGVAVSLLVYVLLLIEQHTRQQPRYFKLTLLASILTLLAAGHFGASLTHGENFVLEPLLRQSRPPITEETPLFEAAIMPILEEKCTGCHNARKRKGQLDMSTVPALLKGGENGPIWVAGEVESSHLIQHIHLPLDDDDHMPPKGKPQLTAEEIQLLENWIASGADLRKPLKAFQAEEPLYHLAAQVIESPIKGKAAPAYDFAPASAETIKALNNPFRSLRPESFNSPALHAQLFVRQTYEPRQLRELTAVKEQLVYLNLSGLPIKDDELKTVGEFQNLRKLVLNGTDIKGEGLIELAGCRQLHSLALSNTAVDTSIAAALARLPALKEVFIWNTRISEPQAQAMQAALPQLKLHLGYQPDSSEKLKLSRPLLKNGKEILEPEERIVLAHQFEGARVYYTLDGSEPDSTSPLYEGPLELKYYAHLRARAYQQAWLPSDVADFTVFEKGLMPQEGKLLSIPEPPYQGKGFASLTDGHKGHAGNLSFPGWLGFRKQPFVALYDFGEQPPVVSHFTLSYCENINQYVMPPRYVEIWGGNSEHSMKKLARLLPAQPHTYGPNAIKGIDLSITPATYRYYKIIAAPLSRLPAWHRGKGDKAWVFVDEVFVYGE